MFIPAECPAAGKPARIRSRKVKETDWHILFRALLGGSILFPVICLESLDAGLCFVVGDFKNRAFYVSFSRCLVMRFGSAGVKEVLAHFITGP